MGKEKFMQRHKQKIYFKNKDMDFYLMAILGYQSYGGAGLGECFHAASRIKGNSLESWVKAWTDLAGSVEAQATRALEKGHRVSAREAYLRTITYYRAATFCIHAHDPRLYDAWHKLRLCFRKASILFNPPIEAIEVPFDGKALPGYFMRVDDGGRKHPTLIMIGGGETFAEELYFWAGAAGARRGYNVLFVDLPGQGGTPFDGLFFRMDSEVPIKAVVDYVLSRPEVDPERLALYGISAGGYMVSRAVVFEKRIKACIANAPIINLHRFATAEIPSILQKAPEFVSNTVMKIAGFRNPLLMLLWEKLCWQLGVSKISEVLEKLSHATVEGRINEIKCPMLCMVSEGESEEQITQAREFYSALTVPKEFRIFTAEEGADAHCQVNNLSLMHQVVFDWLDKVFLHDFI